MGFAREWALKWIEGSLVRYMAGKTPLNTVVGMIKRAVKNYGVTIDEVEAIISLTTTNPNLLLYMDPGVKKARAEELLKALKAWKALSTANYSYCNNSMQLRGV